MKWMSASAVVMGLLLCHVAPAQDENAAAAIERLKKDQQVLRAELNSTRAELDKLRELITELTGNLPQGATTGGTPQGQAQILNQINAKLDRILGDLDALKKPQANTKNTKRPSATDFVGKQTPEFLVGDDCWCACFG